MRKTLAIAALSMGIVALQAQTAGGIDAAMLGRLQQGYQMSAADRAVRNHDDVFLVRCGQAARPRTRLYGP
ncbi:MAG: hypothetical protein LIP09_08355 [Bacteroidales bacterium]|nr:hypothetical protein [Bacteroidales bacterium]